MKSMAMESDEELVVLIMTIPQRVIEVSPRESPARPRERVDHRPPEPGNEDEWEEGG